MEKRPAESEGAKLICFVCKGPLVWKDYLGRYECPRGHNP